MEVNFHELESSAVSTLEKTTCSSTGEEIWTLEPNLPSPSFSFDTLAMSSSTVSSGPVLHCITSISESSCSDRVSCTYMVKCPITMPKFSTKKTLQTEFWKQESLYQETRKFISIVLQLWKKISRQNVWNLGTKRKSEELWKKWEQRVKKIKRKIHCLHMGSRQIRSKI